MDLFLYLVVSIFIAIVWWMLAEEEKKPFQNVKKLKKKIRAPVFLFLLL